MKIYNFQIKNKSNYREFIVDEMKKANVDIFTDGEHEDGRTNSHMESLGSGE